MLDGIILSNFAIYIFHDYKQNIKFPVATIKPKVGPLGPLEKLVHWIHQKIVK